MKANMKSILFFSVIEFFVFAVIIRMFKLPLEYSVIIIILAINLIIGFFIKDLPKNKKNIIAYLSWVIDVWLIYYFYETSFITSLFITVLVLVISVGLNVVIGMILTRIFGINKIKKWIK
ncbi:MAG: hypothetical protein AABY22_11070 [Nanoarchaeota archaeon]